MLKLSCALFLRRAAPVRGAAEGAHGRHRRRCRDCDSYLRAIETREDHRQALSAGLQHRLETIPEVVPLIPRLPSTPLPAALRHRLGSILPAAQTLPRFVSSPAYAVAVSYVLVLVVAGLWGNPYKLVEPTFNQVHSSATAALQDTGSTVSGWVRLARTELESRSDDAGKLGNRLRLKLEDVLAPLTAEEPTDGNT